MTVVDPKTPFGARAISNRLRFNEQQFHDYLMGVNEEESLTPNFWPESLQEHVNAVVKRVGLRGDVVSTAVADWIAGRAAPPSDISRLRQAISPKHAEDWSIDDLVNLAKAHRDDSESIDRHSSDDAYSQTTDWDAVTRERRTPFEVSRLRNALEQCVRTMEAHNAAEQQVDCIYDFIGSIAKAKDALAGSICERPLGAAILECPHCHTKFAQPPAQEQP